MKKTLIATALAGAFLIPVSAVMAEEAAPASPHTFTANVGLVSDYLFRGISQTHGDAALQGGIDYSHSSGFYAGIWGSNISWVKDWLGEGGTEIDIYGGFRGAFSGSDFTYDLGLIHYNYPGHGDEIPTFLANPNTTEVYGAIGYKWLTLKYSHTVSEHFVGWYGGSAYDKKTRGSGYLELNAAYDLGDGWGLAGHIGHQKIEDSVSTAAIKDASYSDWKIGVTKDVGFGVVGLAYSDTNASGSCSNPPPATGASAYCWGKLQTKTPAPAYTGFDDVAEGTWVLSFSKTF